MNVTPPTLATPPRFIASAAVIAAACSFSYGAVATSDSELRRSPYEGDVLAAGGGQMTRLCPSTR